MLTEREIAELLRDNCRRHSLTDRERERVRDALEEQTREAGDSSSIAADGLIDVSAHGPPRTTVRRIRRLPLMVAAAALIVLVGIGLTRLGGDEDQPVATVAAPSAVEAAPSAAPTAAPAPTPTVDPALADLAAGLAFCAGPFADLSEAISGWNGIENWSYLTDPRNPEPHLPALAIDMIDELQAILGDRTLEDARGDLDEALAASEEFDGFTPETRVQMLDALTSLVDDTRAALEADVDAGFQRFTTCDLDSFSSSG